MGAALSCTLPKSGNDKSESTESRADVSRSRRKPASREADNTDHKWSKMLPEILELISDRLPLVDFITFRSVCRHWRLSPSGRSEIASFSKDRLWLLFYGIGRNSNEGGKCYLYSHSHPKCCTLYLPGLEGATVMASKFGWLLARRSGCFFLYNCLALQKIALPKHDTTSDQACTFTTLPTDMNCTVFIISRKCDSALELSSCRIGTGDRKWETATIDVGKDWIGSIEGFVCCSCSYDHSHCRCALKDKIGIYGPKNASLYDYVEKAVTWSGSYAYTVSVPAPGEKEFFHVTHEEVWAQNGEDWLRRFGEKGVSISTCTLSYMTGTEVGICRMKSILAATGDDDNAAASEFCIIHAAWIDPKS